MNAKELIRRPIAAALLGAAAVALPGSALYLYNQAPHAAESVQPPSPATAAATTSPSPGNAAQPAVAALPDFRALVAQNGASVVNISVKGTVHTSAQIPFPDFGPDDPFSQFFRGIPMP